MGAGVYVNQTSSIQENSYTMKSGYIRSNNSSSGMAYEGGGVYLTGYA